MTEPARDHVDVAERVLGVAFRDRSLLQLALIHSSLLNEPLDADEPRPEESNERLEFLGDAVLDLIVAEYLYRRFPEMPEGRLTVSRATLVRRETLAAWADQLHLGELLRVGRGEVQDGVISQRILAGAFESVVGAIYLDQGLERARDFIDGFLDQDIDSLLSMTDLTNYKGVLQERLQQTDTLLPEYVVISQEGPDHERTFVIEARHRGIAIGEGEGRSKRAAEQAAARNALCRMSERAPGSGMDDHRNRNNDSDITTH